MDKVVEAAREMLAAMVKDFGNPDDYPGDDGPVAAGIDSQSFITFKMLRDWRSTITAADEARAVTDEEVETLLAEHGCIDDAENILEILHDAGFKVIRG